MCQPRFCQPRLFSPEKSAGFSREGRGDPPGSPRGLRRSIAHSVARPVLTGPALTKSCAIDCIFWNLRNLRSVCGFRWADFLHKICGDLAKIWKFAEICAKFAKYLRNAVICVKFVKCLQTLLFLRHSSNVCELCIFCELRQMFSKFVFSSFAKCLRNLRFLARLAKCLRNV